MFCAPGERAAMTVDIDRCRAAWSSRAACLARTVAARSDSSARSALQTNTQTRHQPLILLLCFF